MTERYMNFDAWIAEQDKIPVEFDANGEHFVLPAEMPAYVMVKAMSLRLAPDESLPMAELMKLGLSIMSESDLNRLVEPKEGKQPISQGELASILEWILSCYGHGQWSGEPGNAPTPETSPGEPLTSSQIGD